MTIPNRNPGEDLLVSIILDRSGSMEAVRDDTIGAFNALLDDLRAQDGFTRVTLTQFDGQSIDLLSDAARIESVAPLTRESFVPRGNTPLLDAVGRTLSATQAKAAVLSWAGAILVVIVTDGQENASREWTRASVFARVKELEARGWGFIYLGADANAYEDAQAIGVAAGSTSRWAHKGKNVRSMGRNLAVQAARHRKGEAALDQLVWASERAENEEE